MAGGAWHSIHAFLSPFFQFYDPTVGKLTYTHSGR